MNNTMFSFSFSDKHLQYMNTTVYITDCLFIGFYRRFYLWYWKTWMRVMEVSLLGSKLVDLLGHNLVGYEGNTHSYGRHSCLFPFEITDLGWVWRDRHVRHSYSNISKRLWGSAGRHLIHLIQQELLCIFVLSAWAGRMRSAAEELGGFLSQCDASCWRLWQWGGLKARSKLQRKQKTLPHLLLPPNGN